MQISIRRGIVSSVFVFIVVAVALAGVLDLGAAEKGKQRKNRKKPAAPKVGPAIPIRALVVTGGCCHNYFFQSKMLTEGISKRVNMKWTVLHDGGRGTQGEIKLYDDPDWAKNYDVVIHNECFANTTDPKYVRKVTDAHRSGTPALVIHCAMHTYRGAVIDDWRELLGVSSFRHDHKSEYPVKVTVPDHPIMKGFPKNWVTPSDELYVIEKVWPNTTPLATSVSERTKKEHPVFWVNQFGKARVFGTSYGHSDATFEEEPFINVLANGVLWTTGHLK
jgi:type 1 glutamine amidotransferase